MAQKRKLENRKMDHYEFKSTLHEENNQTSSTISSPAQ